MSKRIKSISVRPPSKYSGMYLSTPQRKKMRYSEPKPSVKIEVGKPVPPVLPEGSEDTNPVRSIVFDNSLYCVSAYTDKLYRKSEVVDVEYFDDDEEITETKE